MHFALIEITDDDAADLGITPGFDVAAFVPGHKSGRVIAHFGPSEEGLAAALLDHMRAAFT